MRTKGHRECCTWYGGRRCCLPGCPVGQLRRNIQLAERKEERARRSSGRFDVHLEGGQGGRVQVNGEVAAGDRVVAGQAGKDGVDFEF